jgi:hypothetical protein
MDGDCHCGICHYHSKIVTRNYVTISQSALLSKRAENEEYILDNVTDSCTHVSRVLVKKPGMLTYKDVSRNSI